MCRIAYLGVIYFIVIWCGSVLALLAVSRRFRMMMTAAGMKPH
ncbi:DUF2474 domain-containing protein [Yersinia pestis subsp. pestis]|nr:MULTISPECIES: DUF2474 domain-containing protein [Yersinia pseudotuberculosis complex]MBD3444184.1 DUF2474 domain-containing protein [Yersinia pestis]MBD3448148.1 DUF2474 domain-containing protein [Yersinia pestis]MBD3449756.1 DUF2474 domain-containing protein [Yersinia pestis]MBF4411902.1 DUF2474 domain-containing protein [Yersinia pestis subsp. pestis]MBI0186436.1 DUF2474 domain-containing protein [Yersinia pestis subsp. pestis]